MKKTMVVIALAMVAALALCLVGCANNQSSSTVASNSNNESSEIESNANKEQLKEINLQLGKLIELEDFDIEFDEAYLEKTDENGQWWFSKFVGANIGNDYWVLVVEGNITSKVNYPFSANSNEGKALINGQYEFPIKTVGEENALNVSPMETKKIFIYVGIPAKMKEQFESADITWNLSFEEMKDGSLMYQVDPNRNVVNLSLIKGN